MKKYDVVIPLGEMCATAIALRDSGIRRASYPFDWSAGVKYEVCGNCGFPGKIKMICDDFKDAFRLEDLSEFWSENQLHRAVLNNHTGLQYLHDFVWEKPVADYFPEYLKKYKRRVERFYNDIKKSQKILFIFVTRIQHFLSFDEINSALDMLNKKFPNKDIDFLLVQDSPDCEPLEIRYLQVSNNVHVCLYKDIATATDSNNYVLKRIFSQFIKGVDEYNFATDNIKNYGLSTRETWGRWSEGNNVYISLPLGILGGGNIAVDFDVVPYIVDQHPIQDVDVFLGDKKIANWHFEIGAPLPDMTLKIPADLIKDNSIVLHFNIKNPVSPNELGREPDDRKHGIGFKKMKITHIDSDQN